MKITLPLLIPALLLSSIGFSQDSSRRESRIIFKTEPRVRSSVIPAKKSSNKKDRLYRPTRLGSSSPMYDTYEKNDYGAGAITTNSHKSAGSVPANNTNPAIPDSSKLTPGIRRDTRLGSSSPLYDTYKKNDYGVGAVTTNPNKQGGGSPVISTSVTDSTRSASDSTRE